MEGYPGISGDLFQWDEASTYIHHPPFFQGLTMDIPPIKKIKDARVLALLGDSITTDHISPAGNIAIDSPAGPVPAGTLRPAARFQFVWFAAWQ